MYFHRLIKKLSIDMLNFFALIINGFYIYFQIVPFFKAAVALKYVNGQIVSYILYGILWFLFPFLLVSKPMRIDKGAFLRYICYAFGAVLIIGSVSDLIKYNFFINYVFSEGDAVFVNVLWNIPSIWGVIFTFLTAVLWFVLGKFIRKKRRVSYNLYLALFVLTTITPFIYTYFTYNSLPRENWIEKAAFLIPEQFLILISLTVAKTSRTLWKEHIWN